MQAHQRNDRVTSCRLTETESEGARLKAVEVEVGAEAWGIAGELCGEKDRMRGAEGTHCMSWLECGTEICMQAGPMDLGMRPNNNTPNQKPN